jgi:hypothetical protein
MHASTQALLERAFMTSVRLRNEGKTDLANRFSGRAEVVIARHAARMGDLLPTLYVTVERGVSPCGVPAPSLDKHSLTTWMGNHVARLEVTGTARAFNCKLTCYAAVIEGRRYYGRGHGPGMYLNLRPGKVVHSG